MVDTGYQPGNGSASAGMAPSAAEPYAGGSSLDQLKKDYLSYLSSKSEEIKEQQNSRRYYHNSQLTAAQIKVLNERKQPALSFNRIARKINAVVGLLERQRQDPRGFPRTPKHEQGAEVATAVLRYVLDEQEWKAKSPIVGLDGGIDGLGGIELTLERGDKGDVEVGFETVDPGSFFYDPRSLRPDFSDARYMGVGKWSDVEAVVEQFPDKETEIRGSVESGSDLTSNPDSDQKWLDTQDGRQRLRLVDHWYIKGSEWHWCVYSGAVKLAEGVSPYKDEKGKTTSKYIMFSANVDHDGDRYGFVRNMKSSQDEINARRSKGLHILNSRRVFVEDGNGLDVERYRKELARPDGVPVHPHGTTAPIPDDGAKAAELQGHLGFLQEAKEEIENYGFNPALMGSGVQDMSGRAIALQQQAGIAELGPYLLGFKGWKLRVYRAIWNAVQEHWTSERFVRVTDDEQLAQFFAVNQLGIDPQTGMPAIINQLGSLDVDIILDEGPDSINMQADAYETLSIMAQKGQQMPPEVLIEMSPLTGSVKKKVLGMIEKSKSAPPDPMQQQAVMLEMKSKEADIAKTVSETNKNNAMAASAGQGPDTSGKESLEWRKALLSSMTSIEVARIGAKSGEESAALEQQLEALLHFSGLAHDQATQIRDQAHERAMIALQPPPQPAQPQAAA